jgi:hypothetical protein
VIYFFLGDLAYRRLNFAGYFRFAGVAFLLLRKAFEALISFLIVCLLIPSPPYL